LAALKNIYSHSKEVNNKFHVILFENEERVKKEQYIISPCKKNKTFRTTVQHTLDMAIHDLERRFQV
jgi:hypothetical protein